MQKVENIIIGGGSCRLSTAIEQKEKGIDTLVIEKGNVVESIYNYPTHQTFLSSGDKLSVGDVSFIVEESKPRCSQVLVYYREVVKHHQLKVNAFEEVLIVKGTSDKFTTTAIKDICGCQFLTIATGYYGQYNTLEVEDADLPKAFHYFKEAYPYLDRDAAVIGDKNSAIGAASELGKAGANVMVLYRGRDYSPSIKPRIFPSSTTLVSHEKINMKFDTNVTQIAEDAVTYEINGKSKTMHSDYALAMIGYHLDYEFLRSVGIQISTNKFGTAPMCNKETYETNIENCYITGVTAAENDANTTFIEDGELHGGIIAQSMLAKKQILLES